MNEIEFYKRTSSLLRPEDLRGKKVVVVGLGSGGSRAAAELGRLGISLVLIERPGELLLEHNIIRHLLNYDSVGRPKLTEVAQHISKFNPSTSINCIEMDVTAQKEAFDQLLSKERPTLILMCTDNEQS